MGLDTIGLVMEVEEAFGVSIPDDRAAEMVTVGQLYDFLCEETRDTTKSSGVCLSAATFYALRRSINSIAEATSRIHSRHQVDNVIPQVDRRAIWRSLSKQLDLRLPSLTRPDWIVNTCGILLAVITGGIALSVYLAHGPVIAAFVGVGSLFVGTIVAAIVTEPFATVFRPAIATFRGLSQNILAMNYAKQSERYNSWTPPDVWDALRTIIVDQLGVRPEVVTKDAQIVTQTEKTAC